MTNLLKLNWSGLGFSAMNNPSISLALNPSAIPKFIHPPMIRISGIKIMIKCKDFLTENNKGSLSLSNGLSHQIKRKAGISASAI